MNTANLKKIAPRARTAFITAIKARAAEFGITAKGHIEPVISGEVLQVAGFTHPASCASALKRLQQRLANDSYETLIEHVAYTWFNRFCAIRFMELKSEEGYLEHGVRLLSHPSQPLGFEVLDRAPEVIDNLITEGVALDKSALLDLLLAGNEQEALFRELLLGQCHRLHQAMKWFTEFGHLNRGDMLTSEQHRCHNEKRNFSAEFKRESAQLVVDQNYTVADAASAMDVGLSTMTRWVKQLRDERQGKTPKASPITPEQIEIRELRKKLQRIEMENEILKRLPRS